MQKVVFKDLGLIDYQEAWTYQEKLFDAIIDIKKNNRKRESEGEAPLPTQSKLLFCEHPHVYTLGKSGSLNNLLINEEELKEKEVEFKHEIEDHGYGFVTYFKVPGDFYIQLYQAKYEK